MTNKKTLQVAPYITDIIARLQESGYETYVVGGAIRDLMLGREPKDYDISTSATPEQVKDVFGRRRARIIGRRFKLVHLYQGMEIIEISTFRRMPEKNTKVPDKLKDQPVPENMIFHDNEFGTSEEDAWRRDFTVNALFYDPVSHKMIDHTKSGIDDINNGIVRAIGDASLRFEEDPVRMLRALKLVGQYGFKLSPETEASLRECLPLITHAAESRLTLELEKILQNIHSAQILSSFYQYGFLSYFMPILHDNWNTPAREYVMELLEERNKRIAQGRYRVSVSLAVAAITLPFAEMIVGYGEKGKLWEYSVETNDQLCNLVSEVFKPHNLVKRLVFSAQRILIMQTAFLHFQKTTKVISMQGYAHARELLMIQNAVTWHSKELPVKWPHEIHHSTHGGKSR